MSDADISFSAFEGKVSTWDPLPSELRWLSSRGRLEQGIKVLQMAWRCREDGRIEWRTIPLHIVSEEEFSAS